MEIAGCLNYAQRKLKMYSTFSYMLLPEIKLLMTLNRASLSIDRAK